MTESEVASRKIFKAMDSISEYELLAGVMSAHIQRMICNKSPGDAEHAGKLLDEFNRACREKINWWMRVNGATAA